MTLRKWAGMSIISVLLCVNVFAGNETDIEALWPTRDLFSPQQIAKVFYNMSFKPYEREDLSFTMLIPKDWKSVPIKLSKKEMEKAESSSLLPLCELRAPDWNISTAKIEVHSVKIPAGVTLRHWVDLYLKGNQLSPIARRAGTFNGRKVEDVLFRAQQGEKSFLVRTTFSCHGKHGLHGYVNGNGHGERPRQRLLPQKSQRTTRKMLRPTATARAQRRQEPSFHYRRERQCRC